MEDILVNGSIGDIRGALTARKISIREMTEWYLSRIARIGSAGGLNAVRAVASDAVDIACERDQELAAGRSRGNLHGIPVLIKDNVSVTGLPATAGSPALALAGDDESFCLGGLRAAGAVIIGKTNLSEWANFRSFESISGWSGRGRATRRATRSRRATPGATTTAGGWTGWCARRRRWSSA